MGALPSCCSWGARERALASCDRALALRPDFVEALNNRGVALGRDGRPEEAVESFDRALELKPDHVPSLSNRGKALLDLYRPERSEEALASCDKALAIKPDDPLVLANRAHLLFQLGRPEETLAGSDRALTVRPEFPEALNTRAAALHGLCRNKDALASYAALIALKPDYAEAHWNHALCRLSLGDFSTGWQEYEWRWRTKLGATLKRDFNAPLLARRRRYPTNGSSQIASPGMCCTFQFITKFLQNMRTEDLAAIGRALAADGELRLWTTGSCSSAYFVVPSQAGTQGPNAS